MRAISYSILAHSSIQLFRTSGTTEIEMWVRDFFSNTARSGTTSVFLRQKKNLQT